MLPTEEQEQVAVARFLRRAGVLFTHPPNGGYRSKAAGARMKRLGTSPGVPDLLIFSPPPNEPERAGVAIEMKRRKGGTVSLAQERWMRGLKDNGWIAFVAQGAEEAILRLRELGYGVASPEANAQPSPAPQ